MQRRPLIILGLGHLATDINQGALPALLPFLIVDYHLSYSAAAGIVFAANIFSSLIQPAFGHFADRLSKTWLIPAGMLVAGAGTALIGIAPNYWFIFSVVALGGIGMAAFHPEAARLVNRVAGRNKSSAMSIFSTGGQLGFAVGPFLTTTLVLACGLRGTLFLFVPMGLVALFLIPVTAQLGRQERETAAVGTFSTQENEPDQWRAFLILMVAIILRSVLFYGLNTFLPLYWLNVLHQSNAAAGTILTVYFSCGVFGTLLGGRLGDRIGYSRIVLISLLMMALILPVFLCLTTARAAILAIVPMGFILFLSSSSVIVMGQKYLPNHVGLASGVTLGLTITAGGVAAPFLGKIADVYGIHLAMWTLTCLPVICACLIFALPRSSKALSA
ncbi:MAG: MFS transporter [Syntrophorhabdales bacterium]|jgi:FSR family fosmidomycin resistance protein-like MFS transporter